MTTQREIPANYDPQEAMREGLEAMLADARIRKAAPRLLAALKALIDEVDDGRIIRDAMFKEVCAEARQAIEAAEG